MFARVRPRLVSPLCIDLKAATRPEDPVPEVLDTRP